MGFFGKLFFFGAGMYAGIWADQRYRLPPANEPRVFFGTIAKQFESMKPMASAAIDEAKRQAEKVAPAVSAAANKFSTPASKKE